MTAPLLHVVDLLQCGARHVPRQSPTMARMPPARVGRDDAVRLATKKYLAGERLDIGKIADDLGVNRVTLHRWVGTRDALILEVVWPLAEAALAAQWARFESSPGPRVPRVVGGYLRGMF